MILIALPCLERWHYSSCGGYSGVKCGWVLMLSNHIHRAGVDCELTHDLADSIACNICWSTPN